jgi:DNA primase
MKGGLVDLVARLRNVSLGEAKEWMLTRKGRAREAPSDLMSRLLLSGTELREHGMILAEWIERFEGLSTTQMTSYFFERGFTAATMRRFDVRFDEERQSIIWPVFDKGSKIQGFVERKLPGQPGAKYLYPHGFVRTLFPLNFFEGPTMVLVEGPLDAMWLHQLGFRGALAMLGGALTRHQIVDIRGLTERVIVLTDSDTAGRAAEKNTLQELGHWVKVLVARLPEGVKDPQEVSSVAVLEALIAAASIRGTGK